MKLTQSIAAIALFLFLLVLFYYAHVSFFPVNVVFYSALGDSALAAAGAAGALFGLRFFSNLTVLEKVQMIVIWLLLGYALSISVPTVLDRSFSFYILEKLQQRGGGIQLSRFGEVVTNEFIREHRLIDVRLTEQQESGTVVIKGDCVMLTERGQRLATFSRYFRQHWLPKKRLLMGQYTEALTDPVRESDIDVDYTCK